MTINSCQNVKRELVCKDQRVPHTDLVERRQGHGHNKAGRQAGSHVHLDAVLDTSVLGNKDLALQTVHLMIMI